MKPASDGVAELKTDLKGPSMWGAIAAVVFTLGMLAAAQLIQISGAVIAIGSVEVRGKPKTVQHLDGGVVADIMVEDGQLVDRDMVLLRLDDSLLLANLKINKLRLSETLATRDRLIAEQADAATLTFAPVDPLLTDTDFGLHQKGQEELFHARRALMIGGQEQLVERVEQFQNQTDGLNAQIDAKERQWELLVQELTAQRALADKGLTRSTQLLELERAEAGLLGQIAEHRTGLARIQNSVREAELEILQTQRQRKEEVVTELRKVITAVEELRQEVIAIQKQLERVAIRAPVRGRVHEMQFTTIGGVVPPGDMIMQIVPSDEGLGFRTRVSPAAIDQVHVGQAATLRFSAFNQRETPELKGSVQDVSATSVVDPATGQTFYWVTVQASPEELARLGEQELVPGMPVEAFLKTSDRTILSYLMKPFIDQFTQAFRED